jgi:glycerol-3-phosphate dehydrogenase (NAD(P)+)
LFINIVEKNLQNHIQQDFRSLKYTQNYLYRYFIYNIMKKITILGAGAFGFAIAHVLAENHTNKELFLYDIDTSCIDHIHATRNHPHFHPGTALKQHIHATTDLNKAVKDADVIMLAIPSKFARIGIKDLRTHLTKDVIFVNLAKGLEQESNKRMSEILDEELKNLPFKYHVCALSGGMIAREVTLMNPLGAELACADKNIAKKVASLLRSKNLKVETSNDLIGVELAGALKNIIAIGAGIFDGLGYSASSKSAFVSAAAQEFQPIAVALGAKKSTFSVGGYAWLGDLLTTCFGNSRNREFGEIIGKGTPASVAIEQMKKENKSVEGYITTDVLHRIAQEKGLDAKILSGIHSVLYKDLAPQKFIDNFIAK